MDKKNNTISKRQKSRSKFHNGNLSFDYKPKTYTWEEFIKLYKFHSK